MFLLNFQFSTMRYPFYMRFLSLMVIILTGCQIDEPVPDQNKFNNKVTLELSHFIDEAPLVLITGNYENANKDPYTISSLFYFLSNATFTRREEASFKVPECYHLIAEDDAESKRVILSDLKPGIYTELTFGVGIDPIRNHSGEQTGDLSKTTGMFWDWAGGYKFLVIEGYSASSQAGSKSIVFHVAEDAAYRTVTLPLPAPLEITADSRHLVKIQANINELFKADSGHVDFSTEYNLVGANTSTLKMADSYPRVFAVTQVQAQ